MNKKTSSKETNFSTRRLTKQDFNGEVVEIKAMNPIAFKDIGSKKVSGNLLFKDDKNFYFAPNFSNCIIIDSRDDNKGKLPKYGIGHYILDQLSVFAKIKNRPSLVIKSTYHGHNGDLLTGTLEKTYKKLEYVSDVKEFNKNASYYYCESSKYFEQIIDELYKSRSSDTNNMLPVYIVIEDMTNVDLSHLATMVTIARSRNIYFIVVMDSTADYKSIGENFNLRVACENSALKRIIEVVGGAPMLIKEFDNENAKSYVSIDEYLQACPEIKLTKNDKLTLQNNCWLKKASKEESKENIKILGRTTPEQLKTWLKLFNGVKIFSATIFDDKDIKEYNSEDYKKSIKMDKNAMVFASTNYGDFYCFDSKETTGTIYQWGIHEQSAVAKWKSFNVWLKDIIKTGIKDMKNNG